VKNIALALLKVQQELDPIKKGKKGYNYTYAELQAVLDETVTKLNAAGVVVLQPIQPAVKDHHARVETLLIHADSGEQISAAAEVPWRSDSKMNDAQSYGSAVTYARRYSLVSLLAIATEDDDGKSAHKRPTNNHVSREASPQDFRKLLNDAKTMDELKAVWELAHANGLSKDPELNAIKDARKAEMAQ